MLQIDKPIDELVPLLARAEVLTAEEMMRRIVSYVAGLTDFEVIARVYESIFSTGLVYTPHLSDLQTDWPFCAIGARPTEPRYQEALNLEQGLRLYYFYLVNEQALVILPATSFDCAWQQVSESLDIITDPEHTNFKWGSCPVIGEPPILIEYFPHQMDKPSPD